MSMSNREVAEKLVKAGVVVMPEMVYCDKHKPITEAEFFKLPWWKIGCKHHKDEKCDCECHTYKESQDYTGERKGK